MYENSGNGHQKMAEERMLNNQGRKIVHERIGGRGGPTQSNDVYKGITVNAANQFDETWEATAKNLGFYSGQARLGNAKNNSGPQAYDPRGEYDHERRGHYIPENARRPNMPVEQNFLSQPYARRDMAPLNNGTGGGNQGPRQPLVAAPANAANGNPVNV